MSRYLDRFTIVLLGCGQMGGALGRGLLRAGRLGPGQLVCVDADAGAQEALARELGQRAGLAALADAPPEQPRLILVAVKPAQVQRALASLALDELDLVVSVAAGVTLELLRAWAGHSPTIARAMPNTPCLVGAGVTGVMADVGADVRAVHELFSCVGQVITLHEEPRFDGLTAISGSGPAYVFTMIEALADGGVLAGLDRQTARALAVATIRGAAQLAMEDPAHSAELKDRVASPGGTTIYALAQLERLGFRHALISAVQAAAARSAAMSAELVERLRRPNS